MLFDYVIVEIKLDKTTLNISQLGGFGDLTKCGSSSFGRAIACQAIGGQFEPGLPLKVD